ncbi:MAG: peptidase M50 [Thermoplasmatales archaeon SG8-52-3]|nr:MAG: peptidase M50 [Thermoplasmatales archaeon SG8-52-3]
MSDKFESFDIKTDETSLDIELLKREIGQQFPFYDLKYNLKTAAFYCRIDEETLEEKFDLLRRSLSEKGYIPMLRYEKGEHIIYVVKKIKRKEKPVWINIFLLVAVVITTILTGSILNIGFFDIWSLSDPFEIFAANNLFNGAIFFALPLMSILIIHEMGHYYVSKKHGVASSLPFFLPIPPILPAFNIGTFGALISSRDPMPNKKALFDIGIAGPLAGFIVAIPITAIGIATAKIVPMPPLEQIQGEQIIFGSSFLIEILAKVILDIPKGFTIDMNPILFAGWVGLLITSINLLPAGQLDGGHIFRAVLGEKQKYAGWIAIIIMILTGWWFFAFIIVFVMGLMHPPPLNDDTDIDIKRKLLFIAAIIILILCYIPLPIM